MKGHAMYDFESHIVDIPDYPEPGVVFKDITPLFSNPEALKAMVDALAEHFSGMGIMLIVSLVFIMSLMLFFLLLCLVMRVFVRCACRKNQQGKRRNNK